MREASARLTFDGQREEGVKVSLNVPGRAVSDKNNRTIIQTAYGRKWLGSFARDR